MACFFFERIQTKAEKLKGGLCLVFKGRNLVVIEAKSEANNYTEGLQQAKDYGQRLELRFACSTNGKKIRWVDLKTGWSSIYCKTFFRSSHI
jgi:type I restriction enzyme R subunit